MKLLMISGDKSLAEVKRGAFYNTLEEFHKYWDRIDIIIPKVSSPHLSANYFGNVFIHPSPWPKIWQPFWILKRGQEIYRDQKFDLMTVHEYPPFYNGIGARLLWQKIKVPYVLEIHHIPGYPKAADFKEKLYRWLTRLFIKYDSLKVKAVRVVNKKQVREFLLESGVSEGKIAYIPSFYIDLDTFKPLNLGKKYDLIFVGRLVKNKGLNLLIDSLKILNIKYNMRDTKLLIVGDGPEKKKLEVRSERLELKDNVMFYGWAKDPEEIAKLMNQSKILIVPSYNEGGPRTLLEAMACGIPVIATPVGIIPDIIEDKKSGRIINWDGNDIAEKAFELLNNLEDYKKYSVAGLEIVKNFEKKAAIKNYAEGLLSLIK